MHQRPLLIGIGLALVLQVIVRGSASAGPMDDSFTYGGRLVGAPGLTYGNGVCDLRFTLFDAPVGGAAVGVVELVEDVPVVDNVYSAELNGTGVFGATAFKGEDRWLQVETRCTTAPSPFQPQPPPGVFISQAHRVPIGVVPYALWARDAGVDLSGLWNIHGNAGTSPPLHFVGTTDNQPLAIATSGQERLRVDTQGRLGIGTVNPAAKLHVSGGNSGVDLLLAADADDAGETDQARLRLTQDGGAVSGELGFSGGTDDLRLGHGQAGVALVLKANGEVCLGSGC